MGDEKRGGKIYTERISRGVFRGGVRAFLLIWSLYQRRVVMVGQRGSRRCRRWHGHQPPVHPHTQRAGPSLSRTATAIFRLFPLLWCRESAFGWTDLVLQVSAIGGFTAAATMRSNAGEIEFCPKTTQSSSPGKASSLEGRWQSQPGPAWPRHTRRQGDSVTRHY